MYPCTWTTRFLWNKGHMVQPTCPREIRHSESEQTELSHYLWVSGSRNSSYRLAFFSKTQKLVAIRAIPTVCKHTTGIEDNSVFLSQHQLCLLLSCGWLKVIKQDCIPVGCIPPACWPYLPACIAQGGGVCSGGCLLWESCSGGGIPACTEADSPIDRMTDTCKNITFANFVCER